MFMDGSKRAPVEGGREGGREGVIFSICTGSIYCDPAIRGAGFKGEQVTSGAVLVVKTHHQSKVFWTAQDKPLRNNPVREWVSCETESGYCGKRVGVF